MRCGWNLGWERRRLKGGWKYSGGEGCVGVPVAEGVSS